jgi:hypothetical protein
MQEYSTTKCDIHQSLFCEFLKFCPRSDGNVRMQVAKFEKSCIMYLICVFWGGFMKIPLHREKTLTKTPLEEIIIPKVKRYTKGGT